MGRFCSWNAIPPLKKKEVCAYIRTVQVQMKLLFLEKKMPASLQQRHTFYFPNLALKLPSIIYGFATCVCLFFMSVSVYLFCVKFALAVGLAREL